MNSRSSEVQAHPLHWPAGRRRTVHCRDGNFDRNVSIADVRDQLMREISLLGGSRIVISSNLQLRQDGLPYSNQANPKDTGVAVYFTLGNQPRVIACDTYRRIEHNLRAIAKTIEAQRGILRWGAVTAEQVFEGFKALPSSEISLHEAITLAASMSGVPLSYPVNPVELSRAESIAARKYHPDVSGGSDVEFLRFSRAVDVIRRSGGVT